jgi:hypothetical protein
MDEPLTVYREVRVDARRRFDLYADRIVVVGKAANMSFETTIALADLKPSPDVLWVRHKLFLGAIVMLVGSFLTSIVTVAASQSIHDHDELVVVLASMSFALLLVGSIFFGYTFRKVKFLRFNSHFGTVLLDVAYAGPDRVHFDSFTKSLIARISANQASISSRSTGPDEKSDTSGL